MTRQLGLQQFEKRPEAGAALALARVGLLQDKTPVGRGLLPAAQQERPAARMSRRAGQ